MVTKKKNNKLNQLATKGDLEDLREALQADIVTATDSFINELRSEMKEMTRRIIQHFYVVAERIHRDVAARRLTVRS